MIKKLLFLFYLLVLQQQLFAQINFDSTTGNYPGTTATQSYTVGTDTWLFKITGNNATSYKVNYGGAYVEMTTNGAPSANVSNISIKKK